MSTAPTPQAISALLRKAGFKKSVSSKSRIKGLREWSEGYTVRKWDDFGRIEVVYSPKTGRWSLADRERCAGMQERCVAVITDAGWAVNDMGNRLIVAAPPSGEATGSKAKES